MRLGGKVEDFVRLNLLDDTDQVGRVGKVTIMENEVAMSNGWILLEKVDAVGAEKRGPALDPVDDVALLEQEFGQVCTILAGNPSN